MGWKDTDKTGLYVNAFLHCMSSFLSPECVVVTSSPLDD